MEKPTSHFFRVEMKYGGQLLEGDRKFNWTLESLKYLKKSDKKETRTKKKKKNGLKEIKRALAKRGRK